MFDKKVRSAMNSTIDRKGICIFVAIAYGLSIAPYLVIFLGGVLLSRYRNAPARRRPPRL